MLGKRLERGNTIGLISPASSESSEAIKKSIDFFENSGFKVKLGKHLYDKWGYLAGTDTDRASDLMDMFKDPTVDTILCIRGGYGSMRILPLLDYDLIKSHPKIFIGFSDITVLLNTFYTKCGLITFHGPMGSSNFTDEVTLKNFTETLMEGYKPYSIKNPPSIALECKIPGTVKGKLVGGNLSLITSTLGTSYEIDTKDNILFIEDVKEEPYSIDRMLTQLILSGKLQKCKGVILGQFTDCTLPHYERSLTLEQVLEDRILNLRKPTISNFMSGHSYPKLTLPIGAEITLNCTDGIIEVNEQVVK
jgi:muramoyltetrapeptide carboxypeptidase